MPRGHTKSREKAELASGQLPAVVYRFSGPP